MNSLEEEILSLTEERTKIRLEWQRRNRILSERISRLKNSLKGYRDHLKWQQLLESRPEKNCVRCGRKIAAGEPVKKKYCCYRCRITESKEHSFECNRINGVVVQ